MCLQLHDATARSQHAFQLKVDLEPLKAFLKGLLSILCIAATLFFSSFVQQHIRRDTAIFLKLREASEMEGSRRAE